MSSFRDSSEYEDLKFKHVWSQVFTPQIASNHAISRAPAVSVHIGKSFSISLIPYSTACHNILLTSSNHTIAVKA